MWQAWLWKLTGVALPVEAVPEVKPMQGAFAAIPDAIIAANSTEIDTVTGATKTSEALIAAVNDALSQIQK